MVSESQVSESPVSESQVSESPVSESPVSESPVLKSLSPSRASDFTQCPRLYRFRAVERLEEPVTAQQARGTTAHLALQRLFDLPTGSRTPERLYDLFREAWTELRGSDEYDGLFPNLEEEREWGARALGLLANYFAVEDPMSFEPLDRELDLSERFEHMSIRGILDRIDRTPDGRVVITDYKTGRAPSERFARPAFFALHVYALLVRNRTGETPAELRLLYLDGPTLYRMEVDDQRLDGVARRLRAVWNAIERAIERDEFPPRPNRLCGWCSFRDRCPAFSEGSPGTHDEPGEGADVEVSPHTGTPGRVPVGVGR